MMPALLSRDLFGLLRGPLGLPHDCVSVVIKMEIDAPVHIEYTRRATDQQGRALVGVLTAFSWKAPF